MYFFAWFLVLYQIENEKPFFHLINVFEVMGANLGSFVRSACALWERKYQFFPRNCTHRSYFINPHPRRLANKVYLQQSLCYVYYISVRVRDLLRIFCISPIKCPLWWHLAHCDYMRLIFTCQCSTPVPACHRQPILNSTLKSHKIKVFC